VLVLPRRRHEIREPVEKLNRREIDTAVCPSSRGFRELAGPTQLAALCRGST
jgi:hypothetical protein